MLKEIDNLEEIKSLIKDNEDIISFFKEKLLSKTNE